MPALFAYVIAVGLLLGGGYGALSWLAAPEPVKVAAARVKAKPPQRYEATSEAPSATTTASQINNDDNDKAALDSDKAASASNDQPPSEVPVASQPVASQNALTESSSAATPHQIRSARAEVAPVEQKLPAKQPYPQTVAAPKPVPLATAKMEASVPSAAGSKIVKRPHLLQAGRQPEKPPEKRRLALMILRTIQYPDGRRVSQLLPYRGGGRALAFAPDQ
jgi:hypothetical protein